MKRILAFLSLIFLAPIASAVPVDLSGWTAEGGSSNWNVQGGNDSVLQTVNGSPTIFFDPTATSTQNTALSGSISVQTGGDDDFIGFVLGYQSGEYGSNSTDFFLVDWKQGTQGFYGTAYEGLAISHVSDASSVAPFWNHGGSGVTEIQRGSTLGSTGWADYVDYTFDIVFTSSLIAVSVNGSPELSITPDDVAGISEFSDGAYGFYNYSQSNVLYSSIAQVDCQITPSAPGCEEIPGGGDGGNQGGTPIPEPSPFVLFALGIVALLLNRQTTKA